MRLLVIGSGLAGINTALLASEFAAVTLLSKADLSETNTRRAQGGIAAAISTLDHPDTHAADTIRAGAGLCDPQAVRALTADGVAAIERLLQLGVEFDRAASGELSLAMEGAHSTPRVLHAGGDETGLHIQTALLNRLAEADVDVRSGVTVTELVMDAGRCVGAITDARKTILADATVLATGGAGALYRVTTNPPTASGDGVALALRAGALLRDMEFVQFHPTALAVGGSAFLISEALRGEGAVLRNAAGERLMSHVHPDAELAPRSVVAKAISESMQRDATDHVWLDISHRGAEFLQARFPGVHRGALERGWDITAGPIPIAPAAHYHMGGVYTDIDGRTTVPGLYAAGECASSGAHGANRVASNSLLEAAVFSARAMSAIKTGPSAAPSPAGQVDRLPLSPHASAPSRDDLRETMSEVVGIARTADGLRTALERFERWTDTDSEDPSLPLATLTARLIAEAALRRSESRGAHLRLDFPDEQPSWRRHSLQQLVVE